jgi:Leucine-rich repeat (LRR) protein
MHMRWAAVCLLLVLLPQVSIAVTHPDDALAVRDFYFSANGASWREGFRWIDSTKDPCDDFELFQGLKCSGNLGEPNRRVTSITLSFLLISGTLLETFGLMTHLTEVFLSSNLIGGQLPLSMCNMTRLTTLNLWNNKLVGVIPPCIGNASSLVRLDLRNNGFTGSIPPSLQNMRNLADLYLSSNKLSGPIPSFLGDMASLRVLYLSYNFFSGPIPTTLNNKKCGPTAFTWLDLRSNKGVNGTTPAVATYMQAI